MKNTLIALALAGASLMPAAAAAQVAPEVAAILKTGATVYGPQGAEVGTITSVEGANIVLDTGAHKATLPATSLGKNEKGLLISMTKQQLDSAVAAAEAKANSSLMAALTTGAEVKTTDGMVAGTITSMEGDNITLELPTGKSIVLTREFMMADASGLKVKMDSPTFQSAVAKATSGGADASATADAATETGTETAATDEASEDAAE
ncbi:hypothetical protein B2G71_16530 [Novosphingobium sp. PC22D]|uniref:hypothetical protein n=1 Tax=Novosphingobium sp. PC22D TaxID=1962403 RepID=UPI000BF12179|nr:hypothetical protein [Novosphingobium sp. PC22D]PEQ11441.1 hypothetical protein B2G71_16530 [Novosphingobium sp. PC22D]